MISRLGILLIVVTVAYCADVCPQAEGLTSGGAGDVSWAIGRQQMQSDRVCTRHTVTAAAAGAPLSVAWRKSGVLAVDISGRFVVSFCCAERVETQTDVLRYGAGRTMRASALEAENDDSADYPDLIEEDARVLRTALVGEVWDGSKYVKLDLELRAAASHPHVNQSVLEFVVTDQSSEPVTTEWDIVQKLGAKVKPFFSATPKNRGYRQTTYVFFSSERPAPAQSEVLVKNDAGKVLGRFAINAFAMDASRR
jgi:hypothetical protein